MKPIPLTQNNVNTEQYLFCRFCIALQTWPCGVNRVIVLVCADRTLVSLTQRVSVVVVGDTQHMLVVVHMGLIPQGVSVGDGKGGLVGGCTWHRGIG